MEKDTITASEPLHNGALEENNVLKYLFSWPSVIILNLSIALLIIFLGYNNESTASVYEKDYQPEVILFNWTEQHCRLLLKDEMEET
tara:strand:+ start:62 stop:322 length:261 start_codon:yes stop_codon:yes gene_type:complete